MRAVTALVALTLLLSACSSAPQAPEGVQDRKNRAADFLKFGKQAFQETQYEQALSFYLLAVDLNTAVDYLPGMAASWNSVAMAQAALGRPDETRAALKQASQWAALAGDRALQLQVAVNEVQADLLAGQLDAARTRLQALQPFPATAEGAALEHALGTLEKASDHLDLALAAFDRALTLNQTLKLKQEMASNRFMKASVYAKQQRWTEAETELLAALTLDKTMENTLGIGQDQRALGTVSAKLGRQSDAYEWYLRSYRLFEAAGLTDQQRRSLELLVPLAKSLAKPEAARYQALLDSRAP